ncbi:MAG: hypothetical protein ACXWAS_11520 [Methylobacter sp.]
MMAAIINTENNHINSKEIIFKVDAATGSNNTHYPLSECVRAGTVSELILTQLEFI